MGMIRAPAAKLIGIDRTAPTTTEVPSCVTRTLLISFSCSRSGRLSGPPRLHRRSLIRGFGVRRRASREISSEGCRRDREREAGRRRAASGSGARGHRSFAQPKTKSITRVRATATTCAIGSSIAPPHAPLRSTPAPSSPPGREEPSPFPFVSRRRHPGRSPARIITLKHQRGKNHDT